MAKKKKTLSGGARMKAAGKSPILLGVTPDEKKLLTEAAAAVSRPVANHVLFLALQGSKKILQELSKNA